MKELNKKLVFEDRIGVVEMTSGAESCGCSTYGCGCSKFGENFSKTSVQRVYYDDIEK